METKRGPHGMRAGMRQGGVSAFIRHKDKKVIDRVFKQELSEAVESAKKWYPPGEVPDLPKSVIAEIMETTLNRLSGDGYITPLLAGKKYSVDRETFTVAIVRDPDYVPVEQEEKK